SKGTSNSDDFFKWLNKGKANYKVYYGIQDGEAVYTGITKQDLEKRLYQHNYKGKGFDRLLKQYDGLTRNQARAIEQYYIEKGPANLLNKINSIRPSHRHYNQAMKWVQEFLKNLDEDGEF
ncbi:GIY-YIG nuclease family protein, partial [Defluviitalea phaphyphila]|uniref:hypothetical protein n=1 Tax=Defluviitalea phaphyphila TaxID=1473580 RepID=UPI000A0404CD